MAGDLSRVTDVVDTVADRRLSLVARVVDQRLNLVDTVEDRSLVDTVEERRLSMAGDLNLDMVEDRRVRPGTDPGMRRNRASVKRGASMSASLAMEGLRIKRKEVTGSLAMGDLRIRLRAT